MIALALVCVLLLFLVLQFLSRIPYKTVNVAVYGINKSYLFTINANGYVKVQRCAIVPGELTIFGEVHETKSFILSTADRFRIKKLLENIVLTCPPLSGNSGGFDGAPTVMTRIDDNVYFSVYYPEYNSDEGYLLKTEINESVILLATRLIELSPIQMEVTRN